MPLVSLLYRDACEIVTGDEMVCGGVASTDALLEILVLSVVFLVDSFFIQPDSFPKIN